ncbi:glycosyltransferase family 2 protein [Candidatus Njordibacter sp. Uisw_002]|uniref:glycosyltransferase family 2 protein n=1 Tax=Candidatus Njordibacter sp. Uisw_002 TaxID=3230971 RepID=UPI003D535970
MKYEEVKVSVVCGTYNRAKMVKKMVLGAWNQSLRPFEIVVSDDCSTDETLEVLESLRTEVPILKIVKNTSNSGGVPNWNRAIDSCSGDIIAWCSDDDVFEPEHLERSVKRLMSDGSIGLVHASFINVEEFSDQPVKLERSNLKSNDEIIIDRRTMIPYMKANYNWPFHPSTLVFRREVWEKTGNFDSSFALADTAWFIKVGLKFRICYLPKYSVRNTRHIGNWSNDVGSVEMQKEFMVAIQSFASLLESQKLPELNVRRQLDSWKRTYHTYLLRIFISRSRAGSFEVAMNAAKALYDSIKCLNCLPFDGYQFAMKFIYLLLNKVQWILPGSKAKYSRLGKSSPK